MRRAADFQPLSGQNAAVALRRRNCDRRTGVLERPGRFTDAGETWPPRQAR